MDKQIYQLGDEYESWFIVIVHIIIILMVLSNISFIVFVVGICIIIEYYHWKSVIETEVQGKPQPKVTSYLPVLSCSPFHSRTKARTCNLDSYRDLFLMLIFISTSVTSKRFLYA